MQPNPNTPEPPQADHSDSALSRLVAVFAIATDGAVQAMELLARIPRSAADTTLATIRGAIDLVELLATDARTRPLEALRDLVNEWRTMRLAELDRRIAEDEQKRAALAAKIEADDYKGKRCSEHIVVPFAPERAAIDRVHKTLLRTLDDLAESA